MSTPQIPRYAVYLSPQGSEELAKGDTPWYWNYSFAPLEQEAQAGYLKVGEFTPDVPDVDEARRMAVSKLEQRRREIYAEAEAEVRKVEERLANLLALPAPTKGGV
jgi:hypothetical protein